MPRINVEYLSCLLAAINVFREKKWEKNKSQSSNLKLVKEK